MSQHRKDSSEALIDLAHYEDRMSPAGQLLRYAKGRIQSFWLRQTLTLYGAVTIGVLASGRLGVILALLALAGEFADITCLRRVIRRLEAGSRGVWLKRAAVGSAALQAGTIAACVALCWQGSAVAGGRFFASTFLIAAIINAGLTRPHLRAAADVRLAIFAVTAFAMLALDLARLQLVTSYDYEFFAAGFVLLAYISILFIETVERNYLQRRRSEHALLSHQHDQELAQTELCRKAHDSQRLALVAKYAKDSILISNPNGRIEWVNDAFTRITGYELAEVIGRRPNDFLNAPGTEPETIARLTHGRDHQMPVRAEVLNISKSGRLMWMETSITPITSENGGVEAWIAVERDITEAKQREAELARAHEAAEEAGQAKSHFLANMSHEIRTPMNGVIGVAELLAATRLTAEQRNYVGTIVESGKMLLDIINDILDLAKLQSGKATLESRTFLLGTAVDGVLRILGPGAVRKGLELRLVMPPDVALRGDEGKLRQILVNLVGNALKFTREGTVTVTVRPPAMGGDILEIDVADSGIGIAPDRIGRIFDSFSQADNGIARQFGGTGLGLTICAMLAEKMGGGISVRSEVGQGSVFTLRAMMPRDATPAAQTCARATTTLRPGLRLMIAEDNRTNLMIVRKMLTGQIASLTEAENGEEAVRLYQERQPDLVLMDVSMPVKDGLQATRDIRTHEQALGLPRCPIVALTANAFGEDRLACRLAGLDGFLVKPLSRADLLAEIDAHCPTVVTQGLEIGL